MRHLLILPLLCLMPSAQAMDYIKCEAMMKAKERALESMQATVSHFYDKHLPDIKVDICGVEPSDVYLQKYFRKTDPLKYAQDSLRWTKCVSDNSNEIYQKVSTMIGEDPTYIEKRAIQNKFQADIKVEGCI